MKDRIELTILRTFIHDEEYLRKVLPFIDREYFEERIEKIIFEEISDFAQIYDKCLSPEILSIEIQKRDDISEEEYKNASQLLETLSEPSSHDQWLLDTTEVWCRDRAIYLALMESISIADGKDDKKGTGR